MFEYDKDTVEDNSKMLQRVLNTIDNQFCEYCGGEYTDYLPCICDLDELPLDDYDLEEPDESPLYKE